MIMSDAPQRQMTVEILDPHAAEARNEPRPSRAGGADPNFSVTMGKAKFDGRETVTRKITWGEPLRTMVVRDLSLGDQFELVSLAGADAGNSLWMTMAGLACAVCEIDGDTVGAPASKDGLKARLDEITESGLSAYFKAIRQPAGAEIDQVAAAKNF